MTETRLSARSSTRKEVWARMNVLVRSIDAAGIMIIIISMHIHFWASIPCRFSPEPNYSKMRTYHVCVRDNQN